MVLVVSPFECSAGAPVVSPAMAPLAFRLMLPVVSRSESRVLFPVAVRVTTAAGCTAGDSGHDTSTPPNDAHWESLGDAARRTTRSAPEVPARGAKANAAPTGSLTGGKCRSMGNESCA